MKVKKTRRRKDRTNKMLISDSPWPINY